MNKIKISLLVFLFILTSSFVLHKFYVGVFQIEYKKEKKTLQITSRLFIDDLEKALYKKHKKHVYLTTKDEISDANNYVTNYFDENLKIKINNKNQKLTFLFKEQEENIIICYFTIAHNHNIKDIEITNQVLAEVFTEQQNLVHLNINSNKKTLLFTNTTTNQKIKTN